MVIAHSSSRPRTAASIAAVRSSASVGTSGHRSGRNAAAAVRLDLVAQNSAHSPSLASTRPTPTNMRPASKSSSNHGRHASIAWVTTNESTSSKSSFGVVGSGMTCSATWAIASCDTVPISERSTGKPRRNGTARDRRSIASASSRNVKGLPTSSSWHNGDGSVLSTVTTSISFASSLSTSARRPSTSIPSRSVSSMVCWTMT